MNGTQELLLEKEFIEKVESLDNGKLAMLRRGCGERDPVEGRCPWLLSFNYGVGTEPVIFLVASLLAQYKTTDIKKGMHKAKGNFGKTWKSAIAGNGSDSIKRRFNILLDADFDTKTGDGELPYRLRQMVRYAASKNIGVNWPLLLKHIRSWNSISKWVQKDWARSFFIEEKSQDFQKTGQE
jgi:CRISPR system Cascade subunit CasB